MANPPLTVTQRIFGVFNAQNGALVGFSTSGEAAYQSVLGSTTVAINFPALRLTLSSQNIYAFVIGAATPGDGGGGDYFVNASSTQGAWLIGSMSGNTLTVSQLLNGAIANGLTLNRGDTGASIGTITGGSGNTWTCSGSANIQGPIVFTCDNSTTFVVGADGARWNLSGLILASLPSNLVPNVDNTFNLGGPSFRWAGLWATAATLNSATVGTLTTTTLSVSGTVSTSLVPTVNNSVSLGSPSFSWANIYLGANDAPALDTTSGNIAYFARTAAEISASVMPANFSYEPGNSRRMNPDTTGVTDVTAIIQGLLDVAGIAALDGEVREVTLQPGTYKVRRLYMHYSNVYLRIMPGVTIIQTLVGITNSNTTGVAPAYAVIHINPLNYVANPSSGSAGQITNVRIYGGGTVQGPNPGASVTGITQAASAVVTINTASATNPYAIGNSVSFMSVGGMTQINAQNGTISAVGGSSGAWTFTVNINSSAFSAYTGGGTVTSAGYQQFQLGIVANDCANCWVDGILIQGCGGESLLMNPSSWFTTSNLRLTNCEIMQGGEVGFNNCRASAIIGNYFHDNWFQNGMGIDGDNCIMAFNRIRNIQNSGIDLGGSGARDINTARDILVMGNVVTSTGLANSGSFQAFFTDDGATTVPKTNIKIIGNIFDNHLGPNQIAFDYTSGNNIEFVDNIVTNLQGTSANAINIIAGSAGYIFRGNLVNPGTLGNAIIGLTVSSVGTPSVTVEESNSITGFSSGNINWSSAITLNAEFVTTPTLTLTGFAAGQNVPLFIVKKGNIVTINFTGTAATSTTTAMTLGTLAAYLRPTRSQNFLFPVIDNGTNSIGLLQIASTGVMTFFKDINGSVFTNSGSKGLVGPYNITYLLT